MTRARKKADLTPAERLAAPAARLSRQRDRILAEARRTLARKRLFLVAAARELASVAAKAEGPGCDGHAPEIIDAPEPGDNPQLRIARNIREHPLDLMHYKHQITAEQYAAGELYRRDLELGQIAPLTAGRWESIYTTELSSKAALKAAGVEEVLSAKVFKARMGKRTVVWDDLKPLTLDAMDRANRAHAAISASAGRQAAEITTLLARERLSIGEIARRGDHGARNSVGRKLQAGLDALARHYGMRSEGGAAGRIRAWHGAGGTGVEPGE